MLLTQIVYNYASQEDAHITKLELDSHHTALFAVFDGHGGKAVAKYAAIHMVRF